MTKKSQANYSTAQVAERIGVSKRTLLRWLYGGKLGEPAKQSVGGVEYRVWGADDLRRAQECKADVYGKRPKRS